MVRDRADLISVSCPESRPSRKIFLDHANDTKDARGALDLTSTSRLEAEIDVPVRLPSSPPVGNTSVIVAPSLASRRIVPPQVTVSSLACGKTIRTFLKCRIARALDGAAELIQRCPVRVSGAGPASATRADSFVGPALR